MPRSVATLALVLLSCPVFGVVRADEAVDEAYFRSSVALIFEHHCLRCHSDAARKGGLSLETHTAVLAGGDTGKVISPGAADASLLLAKVSGPNPKMPKDGKPLSADQVATLRRWIEAGAPWPSDATLSDKGVLDTDWWSLKPLRKPEVPTLSEADAGRVRTPIDAFIVAKLREQDLTPAPPADRRTLVRRLYFDLIGLPPEPPASLPASAKQFIATGDEGAYLRLVDDLLASPRYGERWARHWLDVVHYADTHGFDKDKVRPNAWPYRDYVIRAFNEDKPYARFVKEQLAGDHFYPDTRDGIVALGFIAAGPFDFVGQIEVGNGTMEKKRVRNLDRDDMAASTMNTFVSMTAQCARCHNHKFDPISQEDYYSIQAVFAAVDRADRQYEPDAETAKQRDALRQRISSLEERRQALHASMHKLAGPRLAAIDQQIAQLNDLKDEKKRPEFGYHSRIEPRQDAVKWVQVDLGEPTAIAHIVFVGCHDEFGGIGAGFGFPVRYKVEVSSDPAFEKDVAVVLDRTQADMPNPGVTPQSAQVGGKQARYVRMTATKLAERTNDYIFALAELMVTTPEGANAAAGKPVSSLDSIEAPVRWQRANLVDGIYFGVSRTDALAQIVELNAQRQAIMNEAVDQGLRDELAAVDASLAEVKQRLAALPPMQTVYAATTSFNPQGNFRPTNGQPREIFVLHRGDEQSPGQRVGPGAIEAIEWLDGRFDGMVHDGGETRTQGAESDGREALGLGSDEAMRRAALAEWTVDRENPLTWRSIVNRVWQYHFGRGIVETPNDFGRMGAEPTHPQLLDWLAVTFRDEGQSIKDLHRLIVTSSVYRQSSAHDDANAKLDAGNRYLWRYNRQRLEAEAIRDAVLAVAGKLDTTMGGPGFRAFGFKDDHSPHYKYHEHDPDDPASWRRSVYRFIVRSVPDPFMTTLDCADPSLNVARRNETLTALQALALLNNAFMVRMAEHFAARIEPMASDVEGRIDAAYRVALGRTPSDEERRTLASIATEHGLANACRVILNLNEFVFVD